MVSLARALAGPARAAAAAAPLRARAPRLSRSAAARAPIGAPIAPRFSVRAFGAARPAAGGEAGAPAGAPAAGAPAAAASAPHPAAPAALPPLSKLEVRVGRVLECSRHPDADALLVERVDLGEATGPRTIVSGLAPYLAPESLEGRGVVVLANLKPRNLRGIKSHGMLLCASAGEGDARAVEPLLPPEGFVPGDRAWFVEAGEAAGAGPLAAPADHPAPATPNQLGKGKIWEALQPTLKTDAVTGEAKSGESPLVVAQGAIVAPTLKGANIS